MQTLSYIIISILVVSLSSFIGAAALAFKPKQLHSIILTLVALAAGTMLGGAFLHLLPEAAEHMSSERLFITVLGSFLFFFILEKVLHWRHCHDVDCHTHTFGTMSLVGDAFHNFLDGTIIAAAYLADIRLGIVTTVAVLIHEIPQELGDFGVLLRAKYSVKQALLANFCVALTAVLGGIVGYFLINQVEAFSYWLLPVSAGGFLYIAATDLLPELREEKSVRNSVGHLLVFLLGVVVMYLLLFLEHSHE